VRRNVCHVAIQQEFKVTMSRRRFARDDRSDTVGLDPIVRRWPMGAPATSGAKAFCSPDAHSTDSTAVRHL
jgi:hypothetical protein